MAHDPQRKSIPVFEALRIEGAFMTDITRTDALIVGAGPVGLFA
ncbi:ferredoxin--NADP(+) reductase, partial [Mesorhizobium sp. M6A.T.Cr.TU.017.01.1.1]